MNNAEINEALAQLAQVTYELENEYMDNGGECTESTERKEAMIENLQTILANDGVDSLGRWLKSIEDENKSFKAEKDYVARRMKANELKMEYIKAKINEVMTAAECPEAKGSLGYSFKPYMSETTVVNKDILNALYKEQVQEAFTAARIPAYIGFTLTASGTKAEEFGILREGDAEIFETVCKPTCKVTKPRANK